ncbi:MAG: TonB-dependent receptor [Acidobacteriota bacterium]
MPVSRFPALILLVLFLVCFSIAQTPSGQSSMTITVKDSNGAVVPGATVSVGSNGQFFRQTVTNQNGVAVIEKLPEGSYQVTIRAKTFPIISREFSLTASSPNMVDIALSPGNVAETVTVTATRGQVTSEDTPVPVSVVSREELDLKGLNTIGDVFRTLPGTSTVNEGAFQTRPRIRGLDSNRVLILVDGERLNNSRTSTEQSGVETGLVEMSQVDSVEVVRGSGSVLYGTDALGGTVNIITHDTPGRRDHGYHFGAIFNTFYSSNENGRRGSVAINGSNKWMAFRLSQSMERFDNYFTGKADGKVPQNILDINAGGVTPGGEALNSQSHGSDSNATLRFFLNDTNTLKFNYDRRRGGNIGSALLFETFNGFFPFSNRDKVSGRWDSAAITKNLQRLSVSAFYQTQNRNFTNILTVDPLPQFFFPGIYQTSETVTDTKTTGLDVQSDWVLGTRNNLTGGFSFFRDKNNDRRVVTTAFTAATPVFDTNRSKSVPDASLTNFAGFAQDEFRFNSRLKFIAGIRVDNFKTEAQPTDGFSVPTLRADQISALGIGSLGTGLNVSNTAVTGDIGAVVKATRNVSLSARIGRSFRTPNIFELFFTDAGSVGGFVVGNPSLKPETGTNFDTSVKVRTSKFAGSVTYFNNSYKNLLATLPAFTPVGNKSCPVFITFPGTVFDADNCNPVDPQPPGVQDPIQVFQTVNVQRARIQGVEAEFEAPIKIRLGYLTPNGNFSYLRGDNTDAKQPLDFISPFRTNIGFRWNNYGKSYYFDYTARIVATQRRLSSSFLLPANQGGNGGAEEGFVTHNIAGGYYYRREKFNLSINLGVSNLFNRAYSEQFTFPPARGRSFTIGTTWEIK